MPLLSGVNSIVLSVMISNLTAFYIEVERIMKPFEAISKDVEVIRGSGSFDADIKGISYDSRTVKPGCLFIALRGDRLDGHEFIPQAIEAGASALLVETPPKDVDVPWAQVFSTRSAMWRIARNFYDDPTANIKLVGITGTNGKTTTSYLIRSILRTWAKKTVLIGTLGAMIEDEFLPLQHTTPEAPDLLELFSQAVSKGVETGVMEVSSHSLVLQRVQGCRFDVGVFTNLTQDHLDFHQTMEAYGEAKSLLFTDLAMASGKPFTGVINLDDSFGPQLASLVRGEVMTYGLNEKADIRALAPQVGVGEISFKLSTPIGCTDLKVNVGGRFNIWNSLAAVGSALAVGVPLDVISEGLESARGVPGRFEAIPTGRDFDVLVDYAHTPDALEKLLLTTRELNPRRLVVVFGCGGNRDAGKRPKMAKIASELSDRCIVTSDNPRMENPDSIIGQILVGIPSEKMSQVEVEVDRHKAIKLSVETAKTGDLIVIAGKGHEDYQIIGETKFPFDDRQVVRDVLEGRS